ncbi:MAG: HlyD family efflux transporter periplasmic adaptor subunit [Planctomycetes bacterium]|nr:HlyD family efflux transporter periplasmic adaptor subunit [Planctomycetota bacterium]
MAALIIPAALQADDGVFVVPPAPHEVEFGFSGESQADRDRVTAINAGASEMVVSWMTPNGAQLEKGDRMMEFDTGIISRTVPVLAADLEAEERRLVVGDLRMDSQMHDLVDEQESLRGELASCRAAIASASTVDTGRIAMLKAAFDLALLRADAAEGALERARVLHQGGQSSDQDLAASEQAAALARIDCRVPELVWKRAEGRVDTFTIDRLRLRERQLRAQLGLDDEDRVLPDEGINARIAAARKQQLRQHDSNALQRDKISLNHHVALRDAFDHTPIDWIEITGAVSLKVNFQPRDAQTPAGFLPDTGGAFDEARGYGWLEDATADMRANAADGKPGSSLALVQKQNTWRAGIPDGVYHVKIGLGDRVDWDGAVVRLASGLGPTRGANHESAQQGALFVSRRINAKEFPTAEADIAVVDGRLDVIVGDTCDRAVRAPDRGLAVHREWMRVGSRTHSPSSPVTYFMDPRHVSVRARIHQDLVPLVRAKSAPVVADSGPTVTAEAAQRRLATAQVAVRTPGGDRLIGDIKAVSNQPVALSRAPQAWTEGNRSRDLVANEVEIAFAPEDAAKLRAGEEVSCLCRITLPTGMVALPAHLVAMVDNRSWVQESGARSPREVTAFRIGTKTVVLAGVAPGVRLIPPDDPTSAISERSIPGRVKAGTRTPVVLSKSWGRIKDMVEDGARVTKGDVLITLVNPSLEDQVLSLEQDKKKANHAYQLAAETRQVKSVQAGIDHKSKVLTEKLAHLALSEALEIDPLVTARADAVTERSRLLAEDSARRLEASQALQKYDQNRFAVAVTEAARAEISARAAALDQAAAARDRDWFALRERVHAWQDALNELSMREAAFALARTEEQVAALTAKLRLAQALEGNWAERQFNEVKQMRAPATGRLFYKAGWNDQANTTSKYQRDFPVWGGQPIAEILDMSQLSFEAEFPESLYRLVKEGMAVSVRFPQFNNRRLEGTVGTIGKAFTRPSEGRDTDERGGSIAIDRVFTVTVSFATPPELQDVLVPGTKGALVLP